MFTITIAISVFVHLLLLVLVPPVSLAKSPGYTLRDLSFLVSELQAQATNAKFEVPPPPAKVPELKTPPLATTPEPELTKDQPSAEKAVKDEPIKVNLELPTLTRRDASADKPNESGEKKEDASQIASSEKTELTPERLQEILKEREEYYRKNHLTPGTVSTTTYLAKIHSQIQAKYFIPEEARRQQLKGKVTLKMKVSRRGELLDVEVFKHSDFPVLDLAALATVKAAAPFPDLTGKIDMETLIITVPFIYP